MTRIRSIAVVLLVTIAALGRVVSAQQAPSRGAGHWAGSIELGPGIAVELDLAQGATGAWRGTLSIPSQGTKGVPLGDLTVKDGTIEFMIKGAQDLRFRGELSE